MTTAKPSLAAVRGARPAPSVLAPVPEIIAELKAGRMVILVDEEDRENEGDLVLAAGSSPPEAINFMAKYARPDLSDADARTLPAVEFAADDSQQPIRVRH
jgi:hypothetical protein